MCNGQHFFKKRVSGVWTCVCGERRDHNGLPLTSLVVISG